MSSSRHLPPATCHLPLVFYQGETRWRYSTEFADLFPAREREHGFVPRFVHHLVDQSQASPAQIQGGLKAQIAQLLMMAVYHEPGPELLAQVARTGGLNYVEVFVVYLVATQERRVVQAFAETVKRYALDIGGDVMTYADELFQEDLIEGRQEGLVAGEIKGKIETIESLLAVGVEWAMITAATGIDPDQFQALKQQLQQLASAQAQADDKMTG